MSVSLSPPLLDTSLCIPELRSRSRDSALAEIAGHLVTAGGARGGELLREALLRRERFASTATAKSVAFPNTRSLAILEARFVVARSSRGLGWEPAEAPIHLVCAVVTPAEWSEEMHEEMVARAVNTLRLQRHRQRLLDAAAPTALHDVWKELLG